MSLAPIFANNRELVLNRYYSNLKSDVAAGVGTIDVYSISQFDINQVLCIGEINNEGSEIIKTHASTTPTGFTVTLASNSTKPHAKDTPVYIIPYDQIEFSHADTLTGAKTILDTLSVDPEKDTMLYEDIVNTSGYYFTRYVNSIGPTYSDYSDGVPFTGLPVNTVGYAIDTAKTELNIDFSDKLTYSMCLGFAKQMLALVRGKMRAWSKYKEFDYDMGTIVQGVRKYALPETIYDQNSNRSILNVRIGNRYPITFIDRSEYLQATRGVTYTEVNTEANVGDVALVLNDTADLEDTGTIDIFVSGTKYTITYTANDKTINTLTVASDQITVILPAGSPTWQGLTEDEVEFYSIWDGEMYFWPMPPTAYAGDNIFIDFNTDIETINSDMDVVKGTKFDMLIPYLKFKMRAITENNGKEDLRDSSYQEFRELLSDAIKNESLDESISFRPRKYAIYGGRVGNSRR